MNNKYMQVRNKKQETNEILIIMAVLIAIVFYYLGLRKKHGHLISAFLVKMIIDVCSSQ